VCHAVLDDESRVQLGEIGPLLAAVRGCLRLLGTERRAGLGDDGADIHALDGAIAQVDLRRAVQRALHPVHGLAGGVDVERQVALAVEPVLLGEIPQQRADGDVGERFLHGHAVGVAVEHQRP
jgi:hypothetical protein